MDFLDPKKRREHSIRLMVGYVLIGILLLLITRFLVLAASGYGYDTKTGEIIQNGLVFVDSHPVSARIKINGQDRGNAAGRFVLQEGKYTVQLDRDGYRSWKRDITLDGGSVERLVYPFLFPSNLVRADVQLYSQPPDLVSESPDRHWIVTHTMSAYNKFDIIDASTKQNLVTQIAIPEGILIPRTGEQKLEISEWSTDNRHFVLKQTYPEGVDYVVVDRENPASSLNVSQILGKQYAVVMLRNKQFNQVYALDAVPGTLVSANLESKNIILTAERVQSFFPYAGDTVLYTTPLDAPTGKVNVRIKRGDSVYSLRTLPEGVSYALNMAEFDGKLYVAAGSAADSKVYVYQDPLSLLQKNPPQLPPAKVLLKVDGPLDSLSFSGNARFISLQGGSKFAVYDFENNRHFKYDTALVLLPGQKAKWMDGHRLLLTSGDQLKVFDFDGTNMQTIGAAYNGFAPSFDRDYTALFTLAPSTVVKDKPAVVRTELIVKQN